MTLSSAYTWDIFIAHASGDKPAAEQLCNLLTEKCRVFLDTRCLELGDDWDVKLAAAQNTSFLTVVLVSADTERAYYQREEIAAAIALARDDEGKHRVVPIYLGKQEILRKQIPYGLRLKHGLEVSQNFTLFQCAERLLDMLKRVGPGAIIHPSTSAPDTTAAPEVDERGIFHQPRPNWVSPVQQNQWRYKLIAFDFDGTLLRGKNFVFSWEAVWKNLGFSVGIQKQLKQEYRRRSDKEGTRAGRIAAYQAWCERACEHFRSRGLTRNHLKELAEPLSLTQNCHQAIAELRRNGLAIAIISGGIQTFLEDKFPDFRESLDFVFINELVFADNGELTGVRPTSYDFQGKAEALEILCERVGCSAEETLFVGDQFNDEMIMLKVDKAIAYPPNDSVADNAARVTISEDNLLAILPHVLVA